MLTKYMVNLRAILKSWYNTAQATFWATFGKFGLLFISTPGRTGRIVTHNQIEVHLRKIPIIVFHSFEYVRRKDTYRYDSQSIEP